MVIRSRQLFHQCRFRSCFDQRRFICINVIFAVDQAFSLIYINVIFRIYALS